MVKIRFIILISFLFFSNYGFSAQKFQIIRDAEIEFFLHKVISSVVEERKKNDYYPRLILNNQYNAFVIGSKKIYVNTGLIKKSKSLSEVQAILAHEIGHLALNHYNSRLINAKSLNSYSKLATLTGLALSADGKLDANSTIGLIIGSNDLAKKSLLQFSRIQKQQADKFALDQLVKRKISLKGLEILLSNLEKEELIDSNSTLSYYRSHPFSKNRLKQLQRYKLQYQNKPTNEQKVLINNNVISLKYIKNKINAYNVDPYKIIESSENNDDFLSKYSQIIALYRVGKYDIAFKNLEIIQNEYKNYPFFLELKGDIYFKKGEFDKAKSEYEKTIKTLKEVFSPSTDLIKFSLVKTYLQTKKITDLKKSVIILEELLLNNPNWSYLWRLLAKSSGKLDMKGVSFIALAEEALIKKNFIKAKKYVDLANRQVSLPSIYKLRGDDILARIRVIKSKNIRQ